MKPKNLKDLRSYLGAVNQLINFVPGLAQLTEPFRDLLKTDGNWEWKKKHDIAFDQIQKSLQNIMKLPHFNRENKLRIICDASHQGLGKVNAIRTKSPWSSSEEESAEEVKILHIDGDTPKNKPFVLKGNFNRKPFHAHIDTGSPITIFTKAHAEKMFGKHFTIKPLDKDEKYVDYSSNKIEFLGAIIGQVESGAKKLDKVRALVAENGTRTVQ